MRLTQPLEVYFLINLVWIWNVFLFEEIILNYSFSFILPPPHCKNQCFRLGENDAHVISTIDAIITIINIYVDSKKVGLDKSSSDKKNVCHRKSRS